MSIRIINNFKLMVLRAQTELGALLWICFTPKYMLLIFDRKYFFGFFFTGKFSDFFFAQDFFTKKSEFFPRQKKMSEKKSEKKNLEKNKKYRHWSKTYPKMSS